MEVHSIQVHFREGGLLRWSSKDDLIVYVKAQLMNQNMDEKLCDLSYNACEKWVLNNMHVVQDLMRLMNQNKAFEKWALSNMYVVQILMRLPNTEEWFIGR